MSLGLVFWGVGFSFSGSELELLYLLFTHVCVCMQYLSVLHGLNISGLLPLYVRNECTGGLFCPSDVNAKYDRRVIVLLDL